MRQAPLLADAARPTRDTLRLRWTLARCFAPRRVGCRQQRATQLDTDQLADGHDGVRQLGFQFSGHLLKGGDGPLAGGRQRRGFARGGDLGLDHADGHAQVQQHQVEARPTGRPASRRCRPLLGLGIGPGPVLLGSQYWGSTSRKLEIESLKGDGSVSSSSTASYSPAVSPVPLSPARAPARWLPARHVRGRRVVDAGTLEVGHLADQREGIAEGRA